MALVVCRLAANQRKALDRAANHIAQENIPRAVAVVRDKIIGQAFKGNVAPIAAHMWITAVAQRPNPARPRADERGRARLPVEDKNVLPVIGVPSDEIGGAGLEDDITAIPADPGTVAAPVAISAIGLLAHAFERASLAVDHKNILLKIEIPAGEIGGGRSKGDKAAIGAQIRRPAVIG